MKKTTFLLSLSFFSIVFITTGQSIATYDITFTSNWNAADHTSIPSGAHWSKLVGANHNSNITFYEIGQMMASQGIEDVAEQGINTAISNEVSTSISNGNAQQYIDGNSLGTATGIINISGLEVSEDFPLLTLVSMIAPSPDWFIGVNSLNLRSGNAWRPSISMDLYAIDAGTDSGMDYTSPNADNNEPISIFQGLPITPPFNSNIVGTLTVILDSVLNIETYIPIENIKIFPNPSQGNITISNLLHVDLKSIKIYNILGNLVKKINITDNLNTIFLDANDLNKGVYLLKLKAANGISKTKKLVIK